MSFPLNRGVIIPPDSYWPEIQRICREHDILLAADEARMLSHPRIEPEHLLLAAARYGNVESLLAGEGIDARAIHDVIAAIKGFGGKLEL